MIQRKQTLYLFLIAAFMVAMLFMPLFNVTYPKNDRGNNTTKRVDAEGNIHRTTFVSKSDTSYNVWGEKSNGRSTTIITLLPIFIVITALLALVTIFLYKNRKLQLKLTSFTVIAILAVIAYAGMYIYTEQMRIEGAPQAQFGFGLATSFPVIALICSGFAYFGIRQDINLMRSMDRIR